VVDNARDTFDADAHLWLEEVDGDEALSWVRAQNDRSLAQLEADPVYDEFAATATKILTTKDRISYGSVRGGWVFTFWQDDEHVRGLWRRMPLPDYLRTGGSGDEADGLWQVLIDVDAFAADEDENWVFAGASVCWDGDTPTDRYLISLSIGGRDASTVREYDIGTGEWVSDGFISPESKQSVSWLDPDTVLIATDWGDGSMTESGYPLSVRRWERGTPLADATEIHAGDTSDVGVWPMVLRRADGSRLHGAVQRETFFTGSYLIAGDDGEVAALPIPSRADIHDVVDDHVLVGLREDWTAPTGTELRSGDVFSFDLGEYLDTGAIGAVQIVFAPNERQAVQHVGACGDRLLLTWSDNVISHAAWLDRAADGAWESTPIELPGSGVASVTFADDRESIAFMSYQDFLTPDSLLTLDANSDAPPQVVRGLPAMFDSGDLIAEQHFATSRDGTDIPYFLVRKAGVEADGKTPTLLYGYGGFEIPMTPSYSGTIGKLWLERGGAYVVANIRGGGEFGPSWHQAGLKQQRQIIYDDFIAVAEDLIATGISSPDHLGIMGGSNGGLLMGVMLTQRPDLWDAVVIQVPLLDMLRFHLLLAGASWVDEYGSPEVPDERAFLETISPYHRFDPEADYPVPFFVTSTKDDRVHPGHARKLAKRFEEAGREFLYFENIDGGHGAATNQLERATRVALEFTYLTSRLF